MIHLVRGQTSLLVNFFDVHHGRILTPLAPGLPLDDLARSREADLQLAALATCKASGQGLLGEWYYPPKKK